MFSDVISQAYAEILNNCKPDYARENIYPPVSVIKMLAHMNYVRLLSDARLPNGSLTKPKKELFKDALVMAKKNYFKAMKP